MAFKACRTWPRRPPNSRAFRSRSPSGCARSIPRRVSSGPNLSRTLQSLAASVATTPSRTCSLRTLQTSMARQRFGSTTNASPLRVKSTIRTPPFSAPRTLRRRSRLARNRSCIGHKTLMLYSIVGRWRRSRETSCIPPAICVGGLLTLRSSDDVSTFARVDCAHSTTCRWIGRISTPVAVGVACHERQTLRAPCLLLAAERYECSRSAVRGNASALAD
mmetsp:Transcript_27726/g.84636  ORF Transcript_27726/g.84636 Transcript_27726/m.84636 type:complete len:219 (-) Transcript_27726:140-796(-)